MKLRTHRRSICAGALWLAALASRPAGQVVVSSPPRTDPVPQGQQVDARDGDLVILEEDSRLRIVRRHRAVVRVIFDEAGRSLTVLIDRASNSTPADGRVDSILHFQKIEGDWRLG